MKELMKELTEMTIPGGEVVVVVFLFMVFLIILQDLFENLVNLFLQKKGVSSSKINWMKKSIPSLCGGGILVIVAPLILRSFSRGAIICAIFGFVLLAFAYILLLVFAYILWKRLCKIQKRGEKHEVETSNQ